MSQETLEWLNNNVLIGFTEKRGNAWHYKQSAQGSEPNHYPGAIPAADVIRRLFDWKPVSLPVYAGVPCSIEEAQGIGPNGQPIKFVLRAKRQNVSSSDNYGDDHGIFGAESYEPHSYREWLLDVTRELLHGELGIGSAGLLKERAQAWVQVEIPESLHSTKYGVAYRPNLTAFTSLNGSLATGYKPTVGLVVCDNTLSAALGERSSAVRIKHSKYSHLRINEAQQALGLLEVVAGEFEQELQRLVEWTVTDRQFDELLNKLAAPSSTSKRAISLADTKRLQVKSLYENDNRATPWKGTAFGVLQAFNTYEAHFATVRNVERVERNLSNILTGKSFAQDEEVLKTLATV